MSENLLENKLEQINKQFHKISTVNPILIFRTVSPPKITISVGISNGVNLLSIENNGNLVFYRCLTNQDRYEYTWLESLKPHFDKTKYNILIELNGNDFSKSQKVIKKALLLIYTKTINKLAYQHNGFFIFLKKPLRIVENLLPLIILDLRLLDYLVPKKQAGNKVRQASQKIDDLFQTICLESLKLKRNYTVVWSKKINMYKLFIQSKKEC